MENFLFDDTYVFFRIVDGRLIIGKCCGSVGLNRCAFFFFVFCFLGDLNTKIH